MDAATIEAIRERAAAGQRPQQIGVDFDMSRRAVYRLAEKHGIVLKPGFDVMKDASLLRHAVQKMSPLAAVNFLLEVLEMAMPWQDTDRVAQICKDVETTPTGAQIILTLIHYRGKTVTKERLYQSFTMGRSVDELPNMKIIDVMICKIRKVLPEEVTIRNVWGVGYALDGFFPWETEAHA